MRLSEKVNGIGKAGGEDFSSDDGDDDGKVDWLSWVESELPEDVSISQDPNFLPPPQETEDGHSENSTITTSGRIYDLRHRKHYQ